MAMKLLVSAALLALSRAQEQLPLRKLLQPSFGNFTPDDVQEALDAVGKCAALPADYRAFYRMTQCSKGLVKSLEAGVVQGLLVGKQFVNASKIPVDQQVVETLSKMGAAYVEKASHEFTAKFCGHQECIAEVNTMYDHVAGCEAGYMCGIFAAQGVFKTPFAQCKRTVQESMAKMMDDMHGQQCAKESSGAYCPEMLQKMLAEDVKCYASMFTPGKECSEQCAKTWAAIKAEFPTCSSKYAAAFADLMTTAQAMAHKLVPGSPEPAPVKPFDCANATFII